MAPAPAQTLEVSIIVPCRNEIRHIELFLKSVLFQEVDGAWEVVIADGCSDDGTREVLDRWAAKDPRIRVVDNPKRHSAAGLNLAISQSRSDICLRMDVHTVYAPDYVQRSIECLRRTGADNVGGPACTRADSTMQRTVAGAFHSFFSTGGAPFHDVNREGYVESVPYGCWRRAKLIELGMFDEDLVRNEDDELNLRITESGGRVYQSPDIRSWYYPRGNLRDLARQYFQYGFWKVFVIRKHGRISSSRHLVPSLFVVGNLALLTVWAARAFDPELSPDPLWLLLALNGAYLTCSLIASAGVALGAGWRCFFSAPFVFAAFHLSYGVGFLIGLAYLLTGSKQAAGNEAFTGLTR